MKRLDSFEDDRNGVVTYELQDGSRVCLDAQAVRKYGAAEIIRSLGKGDQLPTRRVVVLQDGVRIGTVPPDFEPRTINSRSFLYDPRPGDFVRSGDHWVASSSLGLGDFKAVPGFVPD